MKCNISITVIFQLIKMFTYYKIDEISRKVGFNKINTGLKAPTFLKSFKIGIWDAHDITLDIIASKCEEYQVGLTLTKQSLFSRLRLGEELMKELLGLVTNFALRNSYGNETIEVLKQFKDVKVSDSTTISLPDKLKSFFKGMRGPNSASAIKIQAIYSIISNRFKKLQLFSGTSSDRQYVDVIAQTLEPLELVIFDLGYFSTKAFKTIMDKGAYFISRIKTNTLFYVEPITKKGCFEKAILLKILRSSNDIVGTFIYMGSDKLKVRLVAVKLSGKVVNERRRKENKKAKKQSKEEKEKLHSGS